MTRSEAVKRIEQLLPKYNGGWIPNWDECSLKLCITRNRNDIILSSTTYDYHLLTFNTWRARTKFVNEQESLIRSYLFG